MIVSDLDGTLLTVNSFPLWVKYLLRKSLVSFKFLVLFRLLILGVLRKCGFINHSIFKSRLVLIEIPHSWNHEFSILLSMKLNTEVFDELNRLNSFVLATAAPINYAAPLAQILFQGRCNLLASEWRGGTYMDNVGANKYSNLALFLKGVEISCFYTDHEEDLPTMLNSKKVVLVGNRMSKSAIFLVDVNITRIIN